MPLTNFIQTQKEINQFTHHHPHFFASALATLVAHPVRVSLNRAAYQYNPFKVVFELPNYVYKGLGINLFRGVSTVTAQSWLKARVQKQMGEATLAGIMGGCLAATLAGTGIATYADTWLIIKTVNPTTLSFSTILKLAPCNVPLVMAFFSRELSFSMSVLAKNDLPEKAYYPLLMLSTFTSAISHKFATWESTAHIIEKNQNKTVPSIARDGLRKTIQQMKQGNVYSHPSCAGIYPMPKTNLQATMNLMLIACGPSMFAFRFLHLLLLGKAYNYGLEKSHAGFFSGSKKLDNENFSKIENNMYRVKN